MNRLSLLRSPGDRGHSLPDLALGIVLLGVVASMGSAAWSRTSDRWAVLSAREAVVRTLLTAKYRAPDHGGASVEVVADSGLVRWWVLGDTVETLWLSDRWGVSLTLGSRARTVLRFDDLGLGQVASRSITIRRGGAESGLAVSSYGRIRRW